MNIKNVKFKPILIAILAAILYGISAPVSKLLLEHISPTFMAALLYLGAGMGMLIVNGARIVARKERIEAKMTRKEMPYIIAMILLDILAPIFLMLGISLSTSANASLLNNFEIVTTSLIALFLFKEAVGNRMWVAIALITLASVILSIKDFGSLSFSLGSVFVILACVCWGFENNCTRMLSLKDPLQIVVVKGFGSGFGALIVVLLLGQLSNNLLYIILALLLGFVAFGLSIFFYIKAQRDLGAARTSAYYAAAPFIGVLISWVFLKESITLSFIIALAIMLIGTYFLISEKHRHTHIHLEENHEHKHSHDDHHHDHTHPDDVLGEHSHEHTHQNIEHKHDHTPDVHHRHEHK
ncbi:MAG: DMT family transporter [Clostridiales bacterium]|nr:DMT family transporter [Clostridiales bacterium]